MVYTFRYVLSSGKEKRLRSPRHALSSCLKGVCGNNSKCDIVITKIELDAHYCQKILRKISASRAQPCESTKAVRFDNRTDMFKTSLNVAKIQF